MLPAVPVRSVEPEEAQTDLYVNLLTLLFGLRAAPAYAPPPSLQVQPETELTWCICQHLAGPVASLKMATYTYDPVDFDATKPPPYEVKAATVAPVQVILRPPVVSYECRNLTLPGLEKLQLHKVPLIRDVPLTGLPSGVYAIHVRVSFYVMNTKVVYNAGSATNTHNHLYATIKLCQTGFEGKTKRTAQLSENHYDVYANIFHATMTVPWSSDGLARLHVDISNTLCSGWYPETTSSRSNCNFLRLSLIGLSRVS